MSPFSIDVRVYDAAGIRRVRADAVRPAGAAEKAREQMRQSEAAMRAKATTPSLWRPVARERVAEAGEVIGYTAQGMAIRQAPDPRISLSI